MAHTILGISKIVSLDFFSNAIFPLYDSLAQDRDDKVRKACAEVVHEIAEVSHPERNS